jgi:hypothetical protein
MGCTSRIMGIRSITVTLSKSNTNISPKFIFSVRRKLMKEQIKYISNKVAEYSHEHGHSLPLMVQN